MGGSSPLSAGKIKPSDPPFTPRSDLVAAAVGFQPTVFGRAGLRRGATLEGFMTSRRSFNRRSATAHSGLHTVVWQQEHESISVFDATLTAHTTADGQLVNVGSQFLSDLPLAARNGTPGRAALPALPITAPHAVSLALQNLEAAAPLQEAAAVTPAEGASQSQKLRTPAAKGDVDAHLVWLPLNESSMRLYWEVVLTSQTGGEMFRVLIDAETGEVWVRHCLTSYISNASFRVITVESPAPLLPGYRTVARYSSPQQCPRGRNRGRGVCDHYPSGVFRRRREPWGVQ